MTKIMTPSENTITPGQIGKIQEILGAALRKSGLQSEPVQQVIETKGDSLVVELVAVVCKYVEMVSNMIVRYVKVDRTRTPQAVLDATGRKQYIDRNVVKAMPKGDGVEADVHFFKPRPEAYKNGVISDDDLEAEYEFYGFKSADPYSLAAVNEADPAFADNHPNGTHWKNADGKWCFAAFDRWDDERLVYVFRDGYGWDGSWWFAGVRK
ncbi:MAG: hypothetical protein Q7S49_01350 [bacterium]|nr:hypothetical protein [bacterium]